MSGADHKVDADDDAKSLLSDEKCAYCDCTKDGVLAFHCSIGKHWVHSSCLRSGPPSPILADNYYDFECEACSASKVEKFVRKKLTWVQVTCLALYNLAHTNLGKQGYFKCKEDIGAFIEQHWDLLFADHRIRSPHWLCSIGSCLSAGNPLLFQSGYGVFKDMGWWRLSNPMLVPEFDPRVEKQICIRKFLSSGSKKKSPHVNSKRHLSLKVANAKAKRTSSKIAVAADSDKHVEVKAVTKLENLDKLESVFADGQDGNCVEKDTLKPQSNNASGELKVSAGDTVCDLSSANGPMQLQVNEMLLTRGSANGGGEIRPTLPNPTGNSLKVAVSQDVACAEQPLDEEKVIKYLRKRLNGEMKGGVPAALLYRKLMLKREKIKCGRQPFSFDRTVFHLLEKESRNAGATCDGFAEHVGEVDLIEPNDVIADPLNHDIYHRIFDQYLTPNFMPSHNAVGTFYNKLVGITGADAELQTQPIMSFYTKRILKPYIRRDFENKPKKLKVLEEIKKRGSAWKNNDSEVYPIDFCYVRPHHISSINSLCCHFFWPGIDMSESLEHPDFSVVVLYRKLVIGFGFLVPDIAFNENYISFLFVHPDWQGARIGTFMLYHLVQTCLGKDITLHVSASNSAMLLYQRFGFKPERFDCNFYEKYVPKKSSICPHAFFMRLRR